MDARYDYDVISQPAMPPPPPEASPVSQPQISKPEKKIKGKKEIT